MAQEPAWWRTTIAQIDATVRSVRTGQAEILTQSAGGRPVHMVSYGTPTRHVPTANLSGAIGCNDPRVYKDETNEPQVVMIVAGCHGSEAEATNGALQLIQIMETGRDYAGKDRSALAELARGYRLIIIPALNPDGRARTPASMIGVAEAEALRINQGVWKDGRSIGYPACKRYQPLDPKAVSFLGGYPNDDGYNIMHDATPGDIRTAEATALLKLVAREGADLALHMHSHPTPSTILPPCHGMFDLHRKRILAYRERLSQFYTERGLASDPRMAMASNPAATWLCPANLATMTSLASGALSPIFEQPNGTSPDHPRDYPTMHEESLAVIEMFLHWGKKERFSPRMEMFMTMLDASAEPATYMRDKWF
ncbi:MAG: M14 family zinc carboxypeptidase [Planctomycetota bacterium]